jgi:LPS sulfotransferase NodH
VDTSATKGIALTDSRRDNVLIVHWHDLGRYLGVYGHPDVSSPRLDQLAAEGILFTRAHATAPPCSPSRGSLFTGRYPQSNGLVGLAHHGWEYRAGVRTLPQLLSESGSHTALFGMQHETSYPAKLGFDEFDVSNSYCQYVVEQATCWLADPSAKPFLLTVGFFETHRPYPCERYEPPPAEIWRDHIRTVGPTPNGIWGGKLMWDQTPLLLSRAARLPDPSGTGLLSAIRDVIGSDPLLIHIYRPDVVSQAVSFWRAVQTRVWRGRPDPIRDARAEYHARAIAHVVTMLRAQEEGWRTWFAEENVTHMEVSYPKLWRNLSQITGDILETLGQDRRLAPAPVLERQADQRSDEWVDKYRADAEAQGLPT